MAGSGLEALSNELFEVVVSHLDFESIARLRLASHEIAYKTTQRTTLSFFRTKHVVLTRHNLEEFAYLTGEGRLGRFVENLTLVGISYDFTRLKETLKTGYISERQPSKNCPGMHIECDEKQLADVKESHDQMRQQKQEWVLAQEEGLDVELLVKVFSQLKDHSLRGLKSLSLQVGVLRGYATPLLEPAELEWATSSRAVLQAASETFSLGMAALRGSGLRMQAFDVFHAKPASQCCSLPCDILQRELQIPESYTPSFINLRTLSISITDPVIALLKNDIRNVKATTGHKDNFSALAKLLSVSVHLEELHISRYGITMRTQEVRKYSDSMLPRHLQALVKNVRLPKLRHLRLGGLHVRPTDLATFIKNHRDSLRSLELVSLLIIPKGSLSTILKCLADDTLNLDRFRLEDIFEASWKRVVFSAKQTQKCTEVSGDHLGRNVLTCWGEDVRKPVEYHHCADERMTFADEERYQEFGGGPVFFRSRRLCDRTG